MDINWPEVIASALKSPAVVGAVIGAAASICVSLLANWVIWARYRAEFATELSVEAAIRHFLSLHHLRYRSFPMIRHHLGGFSSNELRRSLVRAGAVRFMAADGTELWALRSRVKRDFQESQWKHPESPLRKVPLSELFPGAFEDSNDY